MKMRFSPSISTMVFDELLTAIETIGVDNTIKTLRESKVKTLILSDLDVEFVITNVSQTTGVLQERILNGNDRTDERKVALALCVYFIKKELSYSYPELKKIFNKDESALSRYFSMVENLPKNPKTDLEKKLSNYSKKINLLITQRKLKK